MNRRRPNCDRPAALAAAAIVLLSGSAFPASAGLRQLTFAPGIDSEPAWSPSGNTIVFSSGRPGSVGLDLWAIPAGGGAAVQLTSGISNEYGASWSPDGTTIAYYWAWEADVYLIPAAGGGESAFTTDPGGDTDPAWSPGGAEIAFTSNRGFEAVDDDADIWIQPVEGESPRQLTVSPADDEHPTWSPDGGTIAFVSDRGGFPQLWSIPSTGGTPTRISDLYAIQPTWSPDGRWIAFISDYDLYVIPAEGGAAVPVTSGPELDYSPSWSPSSAEIVFMRRVGDEGDLWITTLEAVPTRSTSWSRIKRGALNRDR
jgi:Tol biopolymer transport system component